MPPGSARLLVFVAASGLVHASLALVESRTATREQASQQVAHVVDLELVVDDGLSAPRQREPERAEPRPPVEERAARRPRPAAEGVSEAPAPLSPAPPRVEVAPALAPAPLDLSPLAAARSLVDVRSAAAPAAPAQSGSRSARGVSLDAMLRAAAARPTRAADEPQLTPKDGGYRFEGNGFDATIDADGTVHFDDRYAVLRFPLGQRLHRSTQGAANLVLFELSFDLTAWMEAMFGNDPYRSERRWFLESTAELRERLAREAFVRALARADQALKRDLNRIWYGAGTVPGERARLTFEIWDQMAEDEIGTLARQQIEAYVREHCAEPAGCGLDPSGLAALNAHRKSRASFAPFSR
jgi:hypothetical protein